MTATDDDFLIDYLTRQDAARADRAATASAALTDRERLLVKEAAVMGYVRGTMAPKGETHPKDSAVVQEVVTACLSFADLYPTITVRPGRTGRGGPVMTTAAALRAAIDKAIRPTMLIGLQDAELDGPGGTQRINEWADWITDTLVPLVEAAIRDAEAQSPDESVQINGVRYADYDTALAAGAFSTRPTERTQS